MWRAASTAARRVNTHLMQSPAQPFGGHKWSGIGIENGPWGLASFTELQTLYRAR